MLKSGDEPIPGYRLERFLGRGQFGQVWQCTTPGKARAALKFLDLSGKHGWKEFRSIQRVKAIGHPHLMPITALWLLNENWLVIDDEAMATAEAKATQKVVETLLPTDHAEPNMEPRWLVVAQLLGDKTLGKLLQEYQERGQEGIPVEHLLRYMEEAAKGIDYLNSSVHDLGEGRVAVQHCDIKPDNILLVGDSVLICDFGVAQVLAADTSATATGMVGSPAYMAPECVERKPSLASDQYSLAVTYVELRTGKLPFKSETYFEVIEAHRKGKLDLSRLTPPEQQVIRKATSVEPKARYATTTEMVRDLRRAVEGKTAVQSPRRRQLALFGATLAALAVALTLLLMMLFRGNGDNSGPAIRSFQLTVNPIDARIVLDNQLQSANAAGLVRFERPGNGSIQLTISKDPDYESKDLNLNLSSYADGRIEVRLDLRPEYLMQRGIDRWRQGEETEALKDVTEAIGRQPEFAAFPAPRYLLSRDANRAIARMMISPDGRWLVAGDHSGSVLVWDLRSQDVAPPMRTIHQHDDAIESLAVGQHWIASADLGGQVQVSRLDEPGAPTHTFMLAQNLIKLAITPDDRWLIAGCDDGTGQYVLERRDLQAASPDDTKTQIGTHGGMIDEILVPAGGETVVSASWDRTVRRWPLLAPARSPEGHLLGRLTGDVYCLTAAGDEIAFAGDGGEAHDEDAVAVAAVDSRYRRHRIVLASTDRSNSLEFPEGHEEQIEVLQSSQLGKRLASGSVDGLIQVWDLVDRVPRGPIVLAGGHAAKVNAISFDPSGQSLVSGGDDGAVVLWELETAPGPARIGQHDAPVTQVVVLPDGSAVLTSSEDGSVRRWDLPQCQLIERACRQLKVEPKPYVESAEHVDA